MWHSTVTRVFISYSQDSDEHKARLLALADRLNKTDVTCEIDQYINRIPEEGWPLCIGRGLSTTWATRTAIRHCMGT